MSSETIPLGQNRKRKASPFLKNDGTDEFVGDTDKYDNVTELSTDMAARRVWLVKIPKFLYESWRKVGDDTPIGKIQIKEEKNKSPEMSLTIGGQYAAEFPKKYSLLYAPSQIPINILSESEGGSTGKVSVEGTVEFKCDIKPVLDEEYEQLCRERTTKSQLKTSETRLIAANEAELGKGKFRESWKIKMQEKEFKKPKDQLIPEIISLFRKHPFLDIKDISTELKQPSLYLKDVLQGVCVFNKHGPHKGMYELAPAYKNNTNATPGNNNNNNNSGAAPPPTQPIQIL